MFCWFLAEAGSGRYWAVRHLRSGRTGPKRLESQERLVAATGPDYHVSVLLQDDIGTVVEVENRDGVELGGCTAWLGYCLRVDKMDLQQNKQEPW